RADDNDTDARHQARGRRDSHAMTSVAIRRAPEHFDDWQAVHGLILDAFAYMHGRIDPPSSALRLTPESMAADMSQGALLLAEARVAVAGCLCARSKGDALYIGKLAVRPGWQGRGIGRALVEAAGAEARARGL